MSSPKSPLPPPPAIRLEIIEDISPEQPPGFLRLVRRRLVAHYPDGSQSAPFDYDEVDRRAMDAVVIAAHYLNADGERQVFLRSAVRPPVAFRAGERSPRPGGGALWELPAGLIEPDEAPSASACRELEEELGFRVPEASLSELLGSTFPAPGVLSERHFYFEVEVDPATRAAPSLDGSALERFGRVHAIGLARALELCESGAIDDAKTELALRRLKERLCRPDPE